MIHSFRSKSEGGGGGISYMYAKCIQKRRGGRLPTKPLILSRASHYLHPTYTHSKEDVQSKHGCVHHFFVNFVRHINSEGDVQGPLVEGVAMLGHPLPGNSLHATLKDIGKGAKV